MKPVLLYVDDEPRNLTVLEASLSDEFEIHTFDNPLKALEKLEEIKPWIILSDQRMPGINGVEFLVLTRKIFPQSVRMIVTGYSDEDLVVDSVRKAQIYDYIRKPWDIDDLENSMNRAVELYKVTKEKDELLESLIKHEKELTEKNIELEKNNIALINKEKELLEYKTELECWVPPFVLRAINDHQIKFPIRKDLVGITFDIIGSGKLHDVILSNGHSLRTMLILKFSELILTYGGWRESHSGDSCYGHFGLFDDGQNPFDSALAVAREFRVSLRGICQTHNIDVECGIALHYAKNAKVSVHKVQIQTPRGVITQKSFDTTSCDVDLLHRMEAFTHALKGSNIVFSKAFMGRLTHEPYKAVDIGKHLFKGQKQEVNLFLIPSDKLSKEDIDNISRNKPVTLSAEEIQRLSEDYDKTGS